MKKIIANILLVAFIFNSIFITNSIVIFAETKEFILKDEQLLDNNLKIKNINEYPNKDNELLFDIPRPKKDEKYILEYAIKDEKYIKVEFEGIKDDQVEVTYLVNNTKEDDDNDTKTPDDTDFGDKVKSSATAGTTKSLEVYNETDEAYKEAEYKDFKIVGGVTPGREIDFGTPTGNTQIADDKKAEKTVFKIKENFGFNFKYQGETIKFKWDKGSNIKFSTNSLLKGNVYELKLTNEKVASDKKTIKVFRGIDTDKEFIIKPYANATKGSSIHTDEIDQTTSLSKEPGGNERGIKFTFNMPKYWDSTKHKFEPITETKPNTNPMTVVFNLNHKIKSRDVFGKIDNIFKDKATGTDGMDITYKYDKTKNKGTLDFKNLPASSLYEELSIETKSKDIETILLRVRDKAIYTYLSYRIKATAKDKFFLEIDPYKYNGKYIIKSGTLTPNDLWLTHKEKENGEASIDIPLDFDLDNSNSEKVFKIEFQKDAMTINSQKLKYMPKKEYIDLPKPNNLKVIDYKIVENDKKEQRLTLELRWDIGKRGVLKIIDDVNTPSMANDLIINYTINTREKPKDKAKALEEIKITIKDLDKKTEEIKILEDTTNPKLPKDVTITGSKITEVKGKINEDNIMQANITIKVPVSDKIEDVGVLLYPNIYQVAVDGNYKKNNIDINTGESSNQTLVLDGPIDIQLPTLENQLLIKPSITDTSFDVTYSTLRADNIGDVLYEYNTNMLQPHKILEKDSIRYKFCLSKDKFDLQEIIDLGAENVHKEIKDRIKKVEVDTSTTTPIDAKTLKSEDKTMMEQLRNGNIIEINAVIQDSSIDVQKIKFTGFDSNAIYYLIGGLKLVPYEVATAPLPNKQSKSIYSKYTPIMSITLESTTQKPEENNKVPTAPINFKAEDIKLDSVNIVWDTVVDNKEINNKRLLEYQLIKVTDTKLDDKFLNSQYSFKKTWDSLSMLKNKIALMTEKDTVKKFDGTNFISVPEDAYKYVIDDGNISKVIDKKLIPNQVYFYYIRTVRILDGEEKAYSKWVPLTFTTPNVTGATNLKPLYDQEYDKKTELYINFDIPRIDQNEIGIEYDLQYALKEDGENWGKDVSMPKDKLKIVENSDGKTLNVTYKITGLKAGTFYNVKVRILNKAINLASIYTNEISHRTDISSTGNDHDQLIGNWDIYLKEQIQKFLNEAIIGIPKGDNYYKTYYKKDQLIALIKGSEVSLVEIKIPNAVSNVIYLPSDAIMYAFGKHKGFKIKGENFEIILDANTINPNSNTTIKEVIKKINENKPYYEDYYLKIEITAKPTNQTINGKAIVGPVIGTGFSAQVMSKSILDMQNEFENYVIAMTKYNEFKDEFSKMIKENVNDNYNNEKMLQSADKFINNFKTKCYEQFEVIIKNSIEDLQKFYKLNNNMNIVYKNTSGYDLSAFKYSNYNWDAVSTNRYLNNTAIMTNMAGEFAFTAKIKPINTSDINASDEVLNLIPKYDIEKLLGNNGIIDIKKNININGAKNVVAKVLGANDIANSTGYLSSKGIKFIGSNSSYLSKEQGIYIAMKVYELKTGTKIDNYKIRNYNTISNIKNINKKYKKAIQVAFEVSLYSNTNINPKDEMTIEEFLVSLTKIPNI